MSLNQCMHNRAFSRAGCCDTRQSVTSKIFYRLEAAMWGDRKGLSISLGVGLLEALTVRLHECNHEINSCQGKQTTDRATRAPNSHSLQG